MKKLALAPIIDQTERWINGGAGAVAVLTFFSQPFDERFLHGRKDL